MRKKILLILFIGFSIPLFAQKSKSLGSWHVHYPYQKNKTIATLGSEIFVGSKSGVFVYDQESKEINRISKINGLSDVEVRLLRSNEASKLLLIVYENANIDIFGDNQVYNLPQILQRSIIGNKIVNDATFYNGKAYLACSFGIVVIDTRKKIIADSYLNIGTNGSILDVTDLAIFNDTIYAASANGIYAADLKSRNLSDFNFWKLIKPSTKSNKIELFNNKLYAEIDSTLYFFENGAWIPINDADLKNAYEMIITNNKLVITSEKNISVIDKNNSISKLNRTNCNAAISVSNNRFGIIDNFYGLMLYPDGQFNGIDFVIPNGPYTSVLSDIEFIDNKIIATGDYVPFYSESFQSSGINFYDNNGWRNTKTPIDGIGFTPDSISDIISVAYDNQNRSLYLASYGDGLIKADLNGNILANYKKSNSVLQDAFPGSCRVVDLAFDNENNLWFSNHSSGNPVCVLPNSSTQISCFSVGNSFGGTNSLSKVLVDNENNKWFAHSRSGGLLVYNSGLNASSSADDTYRLLNKNVGNGALPSNQVNCFVKDKNGEIWVGTDAGLCIFASPESIFSGGDKGSFDSRQIVIQTGLVYSNFLGGENITCLAVDGANRKWIGTNNGVWLVSADGYTVIQNFTKNNSPLPDNTIVSIGINPNNGEVFLGTTKGTVSYMSDATEATSDFKSVEIYPNPIRPTFEGEISIKGLAENVNVKITDINGNLVAETTSNGGFATWNGRTFNGTRASTGVYLVFSANKDGSKSMVGKLLFVN